MELALRPPGANVPAGHIEQPGPAYPGLQAAEAQGAQHQGRFDQSLGGTRAVCFGL